MHVTYGPMQLPKAQKAETCTALAARAGNEAKAKQLLSIGFQAHPPPAFAKQLEQEPAVQV